ncbi:MAG: hypothetical protein QXR39_06350 [Candidatus Methanomethylicia archaeon]
MKEKYGEENPEYDLGIKVIDRYPDPDVWCYAVTMLLASWNIEYYKEHYGEEDAVSIFVRHVNDLLPVLERFKDTILRFKSLKLDEIEEYELENLKPKILELYDDISEIVGYTGASKVLHMLAPSFFVMWDSAIRSHPSYNLSTSAEDYFKFLKMMRNEAIEAVNSYLKDYGLSNYSEARKELEKVLERPLLKVLDEYNWLTITRKEEI